MRRSRGLQVATLREAWGQCTLRCPQRVLSAPRCCWLHSLQDRVLSLGRNTAADSSQIAQTAAATRDSLPLPSALVGQTSAPSLWLSRVSWQWPGSRGCSLVLTAGGLFPENPKLL